MIRIQLPSVTRRPSFIFAALTVLAIICFLAVARLVKRYGEQEKALARHMYALGQSEQAAGGLIAHSKPTARRSFTIAIIFSISSVWPVLCGIPDAPMKQKAISSGYGKPIHRMEP